LQALIAEKKIQLERLQAIKQHNIHHWHQAQLDGIISELCVPLLLWGSLACVNPLVSFL
jgi:formate/nitrite transporter FocA (FNT family)